MKRPGEPQISSSCFVAICLVPLRLDQVMAMDMFSHSVTEPAKNSRPVLTLQAAAASPWDAENLRAEVLAAAIADCSGGTEGHYLYSALSQPAMLKPNTEYILASYESPGTEGDGASLSVEATLGNENSSLFKQNGGILGNVVSNNAGLLWSNIEGNNSGIVSLKRQ